MEILGRLDFWVTLAIVGGVLYILGEKVWAALRQLVGSFITIRPSQDRPAITTRSLLLQIFSPFVRVRPRSPERSGDEQRSERSPHPNAENERSARSLTNAENPTILTDLPATIDELQRLAHAITLYTKRPNKEAAIFEATGLTKGGGEDYQRFSKLFDTAMSDAARQVAKAKMAPPAREVETA